MSIEYDYSDFEIFHDEIAGGPSEATKVKVYLADGTEVLIEAIRYDLVNGFVTCEIILGEPV
jgi:hypothetical protein